MKEANQENMNNQSKLQILYLKALCKKIPVSIYLKSGIRLQGTIDAFDPYVVQLKSGESIQLIFKHTISTIVPTIKFSLDLKSIDTK